ncbi:hypothetical protein D3C81_1897500 [compost metagenome]
MPVRLDKVPPLAPRPARPRIWLWLGLLLSGLLLGLGGTWGEHAAADGWDEAREEVLIRKIRQGRRLQQVLGVSWYTARYGRRPQTDTAANTCTGARRFGANPGAIA